VVPAFRAEVSRPIDLVEEIGRIVGYGKIPIVGTISITAVPESKLEKMNKIAHRALNQCGFNETITVTLVEPKYAAMFTDVPQDNVLRVANTRRQANDALRCSLISSLPSSDASIKTPGMPFPISTRSPEPTNPPITESCPWNGDIWPSCPPPAICGVSAALGTYLEVRQQRPAVAAGPQVHAVVPTGPVGSRLPGR
jgi:hypothetical protein